MAKEFNSLAEIQKYYVEEINTYVFIENGEYIDVVFNFDLKIDANIIALDIKANDIYACDIEAGNIDTGYLEAMDINAYDINAWDIDAANIKAYDIKAHNITYYAVCFAYRNITCNSINGIRKNSKHFVLDGKLEVRGNE